MEILLNDESVTFNPNVVDQAHGVYIAQSCINNINVGATHLEISDGHTLIRPNKEMLENFRSTISEMRDDMDILTPLLDYSKNVRFDTCSLKPIDSRTFRSFLQQHLNGGLDQVAGFEYLHLSLCTLQNSDIHLEFPFTSGYDMCHILSLQLPLILYKIFNDETKRATLFTRNEAGGWRPFMYMYVKLSFYYATLKRNFTHGIGDGGVYCRIPIRYNIQLRQWSIPRPHLIYDFLVESINHKYEINDEIRIARAAPGIEILDIAENPLESRPINSNDANYGFNMGNFNVLYFRPLIIFDTFNDDLRVDLGENNELYRLITNDLVAVNALYDIRSSTTSNSMGMPSIAYYNGILHAAPQAPIAREYYDHTMTDGVIPLITGKRYFRKHDLLYSNASPVLPNELTVYGTNRDVYAYKLHQTDDMTALRELTYIGGGRMFRVNEVPEDIPIFEQEHEVEPPKKRIRRAKRKLPQRERRTPERIVEHRIRSRTHHNLRQNPSKKQKYGKKAFKFTEKIEDELILKSYLCNREGACGLVALVATNEEKIETLLNLKHRRDVDQIIEKLMKIYKINESKGTCSDQLLRISNDAKISAKFFDSDRRLLAESRRCITHPFEEIFNFILKDEHWFHCEQILPEKFSHFEKDEITTIPSERYYSVKKLNSKHDISFEKRDVLTFDAETDNDYTLSDPDEQNVMHINTIHYMYHSQGKIIEEKTFCKGIDGCSDPLDNFAKKIFEIVERRWSARMNEPGLPNWRLPLYICAFNGGGFDFQFIIRYFCESKLFKNSNYRIPSIRPTARFKCLSFQRKYKDELFEIMKFHDLWQIVNMSLDDCFQNFVSKKEKGKDIFPIEYYKNKKTNHLQCLSQGIIHADINDIPKHKQGKITEEDKEILSNYNYIENLIKYCKRDVEILRENYIAVNKAFNDICNERHLIENEKPFCILEWDTANQLCQSLQIHMMKPIHRWNKRCPTQKETNLNRWKYAEFRKAYLNDLCKHTVTLMRRPTAEQNAFFRASISGGKSLPRVSYCNSIVGTKFESPKSLPTLDELLLSLQNSKDLCKVLADFKGQYPSTHNFGVFPYGRIERLTIAEMQYIIDAYNDLDHLKIDALPFFIGDFTIKGNYNDVFPSNPTRYKHKLIWDNFDGRKCLTNIHLLMLIKSGCEILSMHGGFKFENRDAIFREGQMFFTKEKERYKKEGKFGLEALCKLMGNSFYGGLIKREYNGEVIFLTGFEDPDINENRHSLYDIEAHSMPIRKSKTKPNEYAKTPSYQGSYTLSYAKFQVDYLVNVVMRYARFMPECIDIVLNFLPVAGDTDSLLIPYLSIGRLSDEGYFNEDPEVNGLLGRLSCDINKNFDNAKLNFAVIFECFLLAPKLYYLRYINPETNTIGEKFKMKGVSKYAKVSLLERNENGRSKTIKTYESPCGEALKDFYWFNINSNEDVHYTLQCFFERIGSTPFKMPSEETPFEQTPFTVWKVPVERELQFDAFDTRPRLENLRLPWTVCQQLRGYDNVKIPQWLNNAVKEHAFFQKTYVDPMKEWEDEEKQLDKYRTKLCFNMDQVNDVIEPLIDLSLIKDNV